MQVVYLKDGRKCKLVSKTDDGKFVVDPFSWYHEFNEEDQDSIEEYEELSGRLEQADKIYSEPPIAIVQEEFESILANVDEKRTELTNIEGELRTAQYKLQQIERTKTDLSRYIINREELKTAKRLIAWPDSHIAPRIMGGIRGQKFTICYTIDQWGREEERCWLYQASTEQKYHENSYSTYSEYYDSEYGIKADLTDDEILAITHERQIKRGDKFGDHELRCTDDKWLTPVNIERKKSFAELDRKNSIEKAELELIQAQNKLAILKNELTVS